MSRNMVQKYVRNGNLVYMILPIQELLQRIAALEMAIAKGRRC